MVSKKDLKEMECRNSQLHFIYRQLWITPAPLPISLSLRGQTAIITGSNTGLGYAAALQLLQRGLSHLILAVRSESKGEAAKAQLKSNLKPSDNPTIEVWPLDLSSYESIIGFARRAKEFPGYINFAILNAGVFNFTWSTVEATGIETSVQVNWLGNALLTILLRSIFQQKYEDTKAAQKPPVISIVGSETAGWTPFTEAKLAEEKETSFLSIFKDEKIYKPDDRYYLSKLLLLLFFREFSERIGAYDPHLSSIKNDVIINNVNPGFCYGTELHRTVPGVLGTVLGSIKRIIGRQTAVGARTLAHGGAVAGVETHGKYLSDEEVVPFVPYVESENGKVVQKKLWEEMTGELGKVVDFDRVLKEGL